MSHPLPLFEGDTLIPACEIYIVCNNSEVLMFRRSPDSKNFPGFLIGPGGHIDADEDPLTAVIREAEEETGFHLIPSQITLKVLSFHHHIDRHEVWCEYIFRADITQKQLLKEDTEGKAEWFPINELLNSDIVFPPAKHDLEHILSASSGIKFSSSMWNNLMIVKETSKQYQR